MGELNQKERIAKFKREETWDDYKYKKNGKFRVVVSVGVVIEVEAKTSIEARKIAKKKVKKDISLARNINSVKIIKW